MRQRYGSRPMRRNAQSRSAKLRDGRVSTEVQYKHGVFWVLTFTRAVCALTLRRERLLRMVNFWFVAVAVSNIAVIYSFRRSDLLLVALRSAKVDATGNTRVRRR